MPLQLRCAIVKKYWPKCGPQPGCWPALVSPLPMPTPEVPAADAHSDPNMDGDQSTYRRGEHLYQVDHVTFTSPNNPSGLQLRDPTGDTRLITDFTRLHFCIGGFSVLQL